MTTHDYHDTREEREEYEEKTKPIVTEAGVSNGIVGDGEMVSGRGTEEDQEEASAFYAEIGAVIQGKEGEDIHHPDMEDEGS